MLFCQVGDDDVAEIITEPDILITLIMYDGKLFAGTVAKDEAMLPVWSGVKLTEGTLLFLSIAKLITLLAGLG